MRVIGHEPIRQRLSEALPAVSLFVGPESVGKRLTAEWVRQEYGYGEHQTLRVNFLSMDAARELTQFAQGSGRLAVVQLDKASRPALNALLKTLEDAPDTKFILISRDLPIETITSRATQFRFGLLRESEVAEFLSEVRNFKPEVAERYASKSGGQIFRAFQFASGYDAKPQVLQAIRAFREHDLNGLERLADKWTDDATELLREWCTEQITGRWTIFDNAETEIIGNELPLKILMALSTNVRPRLVVRFSLMEILKGS